MQTQQRARHAAIVAQPLKFIQDVILKKNAVLCWGDLRANTAQGEPPTGDRIKKLIRHRGRHPTGGYGPNGAKTATQNDMGADLGDSPGHADEVEAFD
jgi:hypothetical protein